MKLTQPVPWLAVVGWLVVGLQLALSAQVTSARIACGHNHRLMVQEDGTVLAWGYNGYGQLGSGNTTDRSQPTLVPGLNGVQAVYAGSDSSFAVRGDGSVAVWGRNNYGQLGLGNSATYVLSPTAAPLLQGVTEVAAGVDHCVFRWSDGTVRTVGRGDSWQLGSGTSSSMVALQTPTGLSGVIGIGALNNGSVFLRANGTVWCCGYGGFGANGTGGGSNATIPVQAVGLSGVVAVAARSDSVYALLAGGTVYAWGSNAYGQLGVSGGDRFSPVQVTGLTGVRVIAPWTYGVSMLLRDRTVRTFGRDYAGSLGSGGGGLTNPVTVGASVIALTAGGYSTMVACTDRSIRGWGEWTSRGLGSTTPFRVGAESDWTDIVSGWSWNAPATDFVVLKKANGSWWGWGDNASGQLALGDTAYRSSPTEIQGLAGAVQVVAGERFIIARYSNGTLKSCGSNANGELGIGSGVAQVTTLQPITGLAGVVDVRARGHHVIARTSTGQLYGWGWNSSGQLGTGNTSSPSSPVLNPLIQGAAQVWLGDDFTFVRRTDGHTLFMGNNYYGVSGTGQTSGGIASPVFSAALDQFVEITAGEDYALGRTAAGTVYSWGWNQYGTLANGNYNNSSSPQGSLLTGVASIAPAWGHALARTSDGTVWSWGYNGEYQLGTGGNSTTPNPQQVTGLSSMVAIATTRVGSFAIKSDGTLWAWGNASGMGLIGPPWIGSTSAYTVLASVPFPQQVMLATSLDAPIGSSLSLSISTLPAKAMGIYLTEFSLNGIWPPADVSGLGRIPLAQPWLVSSIGAMVPGLFLDPIGFLDSSGSASCSVNLPMLPQLIGLEFSAVAMAMAPGETIRGKDISPATSTRVVMATPTIAEVWPSTGFVQGGATVFLTGTAFAPGASVKFGGTAATNVAVLSPLQISCTAPSHVVGPVTVEVTNNPGAVTGSITGAFAYVYEFPAPTISAVSPPNSPVAGGTPITITGTGFRSGATVSIGGVAASQVLVVNSTTVTCTTPALTLGSKNVVVTNDDTQSATVTNGLTVIANLSLTAVTPLVANVGETVTVTGSGIPATVSLTVCGVAVAVSAQTATTLQFVVPEGMSCAGLISVTSPLLQTASIGFNPFPVIGAVLPAGGSAAGGGYVVIQGQHFVPGTTVSILGAPVTIVSMTSTQLLIQMPMAVPGPVDVVITSAQGCPNSFTYTYY